ncbi:MAG TPA: LPS assembly lipoprotein LptE [Burkholderiales bacterium]|nr:LPS assembly lipoprotein LptE [Burkholderiales bacterium]
MRNESNQFGVLPRFLSWLTCVKGRCFFRLHPSAFILIFLLSSCGFHLRGAADLPFQTLLITGAVSDFRDELRRAIEARSETEVVADAESAQATLQIIREDREKSILALSGGGRVREFELRYRVSYRVLNAEKREIGPVGEILLRRDFTYDDAQALAKEAEEAELFRDMRTDAVQQILRRLSAL